MKEKEMEKGDCGPPTRKVFFFEILSDLHQAVPDHLADESQTRQPDTPDRWAGESEPRCTSSQAGLLTVQLDIILHLRSETWTQYSAVDAARVKVHHRPCSFEDGPVVYPANAFDSRLRGTAWFKSDKISKKEFIGLLRVRVKGTVAVCVCVWCL